MLTDHYFVTMRWKPSIKYFFLAPTLKSLMQIFYGRHDDLVDHYDIHVSIYHLTRLLSYLTLYMSYIRSRNRLTSAGTWFHAGFLAGSVLLICLVFCVVVSCVRVLFVLRSVSCVPLVASVPGLLILECPFGFLLRLFSLLLSLILVSKWSFFNMHQYSYYRSKFAIDTQDNFSRANLSFTNGSKAHLWLYSNILCIYTFL